ncbi:MAG: lysoplasmalogenase family protein [Actinomycetes bacterium]
MSPARAGYLALALLDTGLAATGHSRARRFSKPLLMPVLAAHRDRPTQRALALSGAGDVALLGDGDRAFTAGLASFLAAHVAWVAALRGRGGGGRLRRTPALALPYVAAWAGLNAYLWPRTGRDRVPVLLYSTALAATALAALDSDDARAAAGGALFMASDALLALHRFAGADLPAHEGWVMGTYTSAQALLAAGGATD